MRKRWTWNPWPWVALWTLGGFVAWIICMALLNGCDQLGCGVDAGHISAPVAIFGIIWLAPWLLAASYRILLVLWHARPRRISKPLPDLREEVKS